MGTVFDMEASTVNKIKIFWSLISRRTGPVLFSTLPLGPRTLPDFGLVPISVCYMNKLRNTIYNKQIGIAVVKYSD